MAQKRPAGRPRCPRRGTAPLRGDRASPRSSRSSATRSCSTALDRGRPVRAPGRRGRRRSRRQDARRDLESVREPGRVPGRDDGAGARRRRLDRVARVPGARRPPRRRRLARRPVRGRVGARAAPGRRAEGGLRVAVGAVAEHRPLRALEQAHQRAEHGGERAVGERLEQVFAEAIEHFGPRTARGHDDHRPRRRGGEPDRGRVAQPVPDHAPPVRPGRSRSPRSCSARAGCCGRGRPSRDERQRANSEISAKGSGPTCR